MGAVLEEFRENEKFDEAAVIEAASNFLVNNSGAITDVVITTEFDRKGYVSRNAVDEYNTSYRGGDDQLVIAIIMRVSEYDRIFVHADEVVSEAKQALQVRDEVRKAAEREKSEGKIADLRAQIAAEEAKLSNLS